MIVCFAVGMILITSLLYTLCLVPCIEEPERNTTRGFSSTQSETNMLPGRDEEEDPVAGSRSTDQLSNASSGYETGVSALRGGTAGGGPNTLAALLESVLSALDEPKGGCGF